MIEYRRLPDWLLHAYPRSLTDLHVASLVAAAETLFPPARALTDTSGQFFDDPARPDSAGGTALPARSGPG